MFWVLLLLASPVVHSAAQGTGAGSTGSAVEGPALEGPALEGRILDSDGRALAGAWAVLEAIDPWATIEFQRPDGDSPDGDSPDGDSPGGNIHGPVARAVTDAQGRFRLQAPDLGLWRVRVGRRGFAEQTLDLRPLVFDRVLPDVALARSTPLEVTLRSSQGEPLVGRVLARLGGSGLGEPKPREPTWLNLDWQAGEPAATTDGKGKALLPVAPTVEEVRVEAWVPGHVPAHRQVQLGGRSRARLDLRLTPGEPQSLKIVDSAGRPLAGVLVGLEDWRLAIGASGSDGRVEVVLPGPPMEEEAPRLALWGPNGEHEVLLAAAVLPEQEDRPGAEATAREDAAAREDSAIREDPATAGGDELGSGTPPTIVELELAPPRRIHGQVLSTETHQGLAGALVLDFFSREGWLAESRTDGSFELPVGSERGVLLAVAPGYHEATKLFESKRSPPGEDESKPSILSLYPAASLVGRVLGPDRVPLAGAEVFIVLSFGGGYSASMRVARSDEQGQFRWPLVPIGVAFELRAEPPEPLRGLAPAVVEQAPYDSGEARNGVELLLSEGVSGIGEVLDGRAEPIVGAVVRLLEPDHVFSSSGPSDLQPPEAHTDGEGRFVFSGLGPGRIDLEARAPGFAPLRVRGLEIPAGEREVALGTLILAEGVTVEGCLRDTDGQPVVDAQIVVAEVGEMYSALFLVYEGERQADARSDTRGRFQVLDRSDGEQIELAVIHPDHVPARLGSLSLPLDSPIDVVLQTAGLVRGRVLDTESRPIAGAGVEVIASGPHGATSRRFGARPPQATTDDGGHFEMTGVEPGSATVQARAQGFLAQRVSGLVVSADEPLEGIELVLERGSVLEGEVTLDDGRPAAGAVVSVFDFANHERWGFEVADGDGLYRIEGLARGPAMARASYGEGARSSKSVDIVAGTQRLDFELEKGFAVRGRVVGPDREPIEGATVTLSAVDSGKIGQETTSRRAGEFLFGEVPAGRYRLSAHRQGFGVGRRDEILEIDGPAGPFEVQLQAGVDLVGWVLGLEPEVLGRVTLRSESDWLNQTHPNFEGRYRLEGLSPGHHRVVAEVGDGGRRTEASIELEAGMGEVELDLEFTAGHLVTGVLLREDQPMAGASLGLRGVDIAYRSALTTSSFEGRFRFEGVPEGYFELSVFESASDLHHVEPIEIRGDEDFQVEIATGAVVGRVSVADGLPAAGARVVLQSLGGRSRFEPETVADADGRFRFLAVLEGDWRVTAVKPAHVAASVEVEVRRGLEPEEVEIRLEPASGLTLHMTHEGLPWAGLLWVAFLGPGGVVVPGGQFHADHQGRALIDRAPEQATQLIVGTTDHAQVTLPIRVPGEAEVALETGGRLDLSIPELVESPATAELSLVRADGRPYYWIHHTGRAETVKTFRGGRVHTWSLAPGPWTITVRAEDGRGWQAPVTIVGEGVTRLELGPPGSSSGNVEER